MSVFEKRSPRDLGCGFIALSCLLLGFMAGRSIDSDKLIQTTRELREERELSKELAMELQMLKASIAAGLNLKID